MPFNYDKCKAMHFGSRNAENMYTMDLGVNVAPHVIDKTFVERDLGIMISGDLKWANNL